MKIGLLLPSINMSASYRRRIFAPKKLFLQLADGLVERGHKVYVYSVKGLVTKAKVVAGTDYLVKHALPSVKFREGNLIWRKKLAKQFTRTEFELDTTANAYLHGQRVGLDLMHSYHDYMAHYVSKLADFPTVYTLHDPPYPEGTMEKWRLDRFPNDVYIPISRSHRDSFGGKIKFSPVVYHGLDMSSYKIRVNKKNYLAFMGRYLKEKGVVEAIETAIKTKIPLHIAGDRAYHKLKYYQQQIKPLINRGHVREVGFMDGEKKNEFLGYAKAFLFPIKWEEPFGMVLLEAMACGCPVVAFNNGSVSEIVVDGKTGYVVDARQGVAGLIKAVDKLMSLSDVQYTDMVHACRAQVEENFTVEKMVEGYERVYQRIVNSV